MDDSTATWHAPDAAGPDDKHVPALVLVYSAEEPERVGEVALLAKGERIRAVGHQATSPHPRSPSRHRPPWLIPGAAPTRCPARASLRKSARAPNLTTPSFRDRMVARSLIDAVDTATNLIGVEPD